MLVGVAALLMCASVIVLAACGGNGGDGKPETTPTAGPEQARRMAAIPDLSCEDCPSKADVAGDEKLNGSEAMDAIEASKEASDIYALAGGLGYHDVLQGLKTTYTDGTVVHSALIRGEEKGAAILATSTGSTAASVLIRLDPENPDRLIVTDGKGSATVTWAGGLLDSQETHGSCRYWHCVGSAIAWLYTDSWYADLLGDVCHECAEELDEYTCGLCLAASPSGLLAGVVDCGIDKCDRCENDSCGDDDVKSRACQMDFLTTSSTHVAVYAIYETVDDYYCQNPGQGNSQCMVNTNALRKAEVCPGDCAADGVSCAPAPLRTCDAAACAAHAEVTGTARCSSYRTGPPDRRQEHWRATWTGRPWSCQPDGAGGSLCVPGSEETHTTNCPYGCSADGTACYSPPTATPTSTLTPLPTLTPTATRTPLPSCDPATCNREEMEGDPRCAYSYVDYVVEQTYRRYFCQAQRLGGSTCESATDTRTVAHCPYGCAADGQSCAQPTPGTVPAAPTNFLVLQHPGGTQFEWQDSSNNEDGFRIYYGGRSVGRPSTLIATTGPNTSSLDTDFVRPGEESCWEIYAFNASGESAPAYYCLPP